MAHDRLPFSAERFRKAAQHLRGIDRRVLALRTSEGLGVAGIAERLEITPAKARRVLARAVRKTLAELDRIERRERWRRKLRRWKPW